MGRAKAVQKGTGNPGSVDCSGTLGDFQAEIERWCLLPQSNLSVGVESGDGQERSRIIRTKVVIRRRAVYTAKLGFYATGSRIKHSWASSLLR